MTFRFVFAPVPIDERGPEAVVCQGQLLLCGPAQCLGRRDEIFAYVTSKIRWIIGVDRNADAGMEEPTQIVMFEAGKDPQRDIREGLNHSHSIVPGGFDVTS